MKRRILLAFCAVFLPLAAQDLPPLRLKAGLAPPNLLAGASKEPAGARAAAAGRRLHWLVQFSEEPDEALIERLGWLDIRVLQYVPDQALLVSAPAETEWAVTGAAYVTLLPPEVKLSPMLPAAGEVTAVVELHLDADSGEGVRLAAQAGFELLLHPDLAPNALLVRGEAGSLRKLAESDAVAYVYPASEALRDRIPLVACMGGLAGRAALNGSNLASTFGEGWDGPGLGPATLAVYLGPLPPVLDRNLAISEIRRALGEWAGPVQLTFTETSVARLRRQIEVLAAAGEHGDGFPFDGRGGVLAHTFYPPPNPETIAGDLHLDLDEPWKVGADIDLFSVVLHELGHALGLGHSDDPSSVMYPYYRRVSGLSPADMAEIRRLYAPRSSSTEPPATPALPANPGNPGTPSTPVPQPPSTPTAPPNGDTTRPMLTITFPYSPVYATSGDSITVRGSATDNVGVREIRWATRQSSGLAQGPAPAFAAGPIPLVKGFNPITITAVDQAGNTAVRTLSITRY